MKGKKVPLKQIYKAIDDISIQMKWHFLNTLIEYKEIFAGRTQQDINDIREAIIEKVCEEIKRYE